MNQIFHAPNNLCMSLQKSFLCCLLGQRKNPFHQCRYTTKLVISEVNKRNAQILIMGTPYFKGNIKWRWVILKNRCQLYQRPSPKYSPVVGWKNILYRCLSTSYAMTSAANQFSVGCLMPEKCCVWDCFVAPKYTVCQFMLVTDCGATRIALLVAQSISCDTVASVPVINTKHNNMDSWTPTQLWTLNHFALSKWLPFYFMRMRMIIVCNNKLSTLTFLAQIN